jgi:2-polyprenyl-3-methyl-5-hydroxy-6-metoxy-1,4-benzoquinol methylase
MFIQAQYDDLKVKTQDLYANTKYDILESHLADLDRLRILNAGCGSGELSLRLAALGHEVVGFDLEPAHVDLARDNLAAVRAACSTSGQELRCRFQVSSIEDFAGEGEYDCVVSTDVLEHIQDDRAAFGRLAEWCRPGGIVLLAVPAGPWLFGFHDEQLGHFRRYTRRTLRALVEERCDVTSLRYFGFTLVPVCLMYSKWLRRPYPVAASGDARRRPVRAWLLRTLMTLDRRLPMPVGTSLLLKGIRKAA